MIQIQMTRAEYEAKKAEVALNYGVEVFGDSGEVQHAGCAVWYSFSGDALTLTVTHRPFFASEQTVENQIRAWFAGS